MTGYAVADTTNDPLTVPIRGQLPAEQFQSMVDADYSDRIDIQLVIEKFVINAGSVRKSRAGMHDAIETIGVLKYLARKAGWPEPLYQLPADVMRLVDNAALRNLGWFARGQEHANDALRHLVTWSIKENRLGRKELHPA